MSDNQNENSIITMISRQLDDIVKSGATDEEIAEFVTELTSDLSVRKAYINGFIDNPQEYLDNVTEYDGEIKNGAVLGIIATGIFTFFTGGLGLALIGVAAGLIQYWLRDPKKETPKKDPKFAQSFEGSISGDVAKFGDTVPAIFTSVREDPTGGVQTSGKLIFSLVATINGVLTLYVRYALSMGEVKFVDTTKTLINEQPLSSFNPADYTLTVLGGNASQVVPSQFNFHCQNFVPPNNNRAGCRLIDEDAVVPPANFTVLTTSEEDYFNYGLSENYVWYASGSVSNPIYFRVLGRNTTGTSPNFQYVLQTDGAFPVGNAKIFKIISAFYRTTKRVSGVDLNFSLSVFGRNKDNELINYAALYTLDIKRYTDSPWTRICYLLVFSKNPTRLLRGITIGGLPLNIYDFKISPEPYCAATGDVFELNDTSPPAIFARNLPNGINCSITLQGVPTGLSVAVINSLIDQSKARTPSNSDQQGWSLTLSSVNEKEQPLSPAAVNLPGICTAQAIIRLNEAINGTVSLTWFVAEGILVKKGLYVSNVAPGFTPLKVPFAPGVFPGYVSNTNPTFLYLRNLDKRLESQVFGVSNNYTSIDLVNPVGLELGDRWLLYRVDSTCLWSEIYAALIDNPVFGVSKQVIADYYIDWQSILDANFYCGGNNEHNTGFFWHGILSQQQDISTVNAENARKVMLQPWRGNGQTGFYPQKTPPTAALYTSGNSSNLRLEYTINDRNPINTVSVVYLQQEHRFVDGAIKFQTQSVTAQTFAARKSLVPEYTQSVQLKNCTSRAQAIKSAQMLLNIARYNGRIIASLDAKTIESMSLTLGDNFRLFTASTIYDQEQSGIVVQASTATTPYSFRLDREFTLVDSRVTSSTATTFTDANMNFIKAGVAVGDIVKNLETNATTIITAIPNASTITCASPLPADTHYQIGDLTTSNLVFTISSGNVTAIPAPFTCQYRPDGHIWFVMNSTIFIPNVGDVVGIGKPQNYDRLFQSIAIDIKSPQEMEPGKSDMAVGIVGSSWDSRLYNYSDITVITRDNIINEAP